MIPFPAVVVVDHPLVRHKLTRLRQADTDSAGFRRLTREITLLLACEATRDLPLQPVEIRTPLEPMRGDMLAGIGPCLVSILRAGNGMLDAMLELLPEAPVGHVGLYRDPATLEPVEYYLRLPDRLSERACIVLDPMLATGHSAIAAVHRLRAAGAARITLVCLLSTPEGLAAFAAAHPGVRVVTAAVDRGLDAHGYIRPGLGDAGDRLFGTGQRAAASGGGWDEGGNAS